MGKVHGSLARAGKVKSQTPKVEKQEKPKTPKGRAHKRMLYNRRYVLLTYTQLRQRRGHSRWQAPYELERGQVNEPRSGPCGKRTELLGFTVYLCSQRLAVRQAHGVSPLWHPCSRLCSEP